MSLVAVAVATSSAGRSHIAGPYWTLSGLPRNRYMKGAGASLRETLSDRSSRARMRLSAALNLKRLLQGPELEVRTLWEGRARHSGLRVPV